MGDTSRCRFFCWADDQMFNTAHEDLSSSQSTPQSSQLQRAENARAPMTPQGSPQKRRLSPLHLNDGPETPSERRRREIQLVFDEDQQMNPSASSSSQQRRPTPVDNPVRTSTSDPPSQSAGTQSSTSDVEEYLFSSPSHGNLSYDRPSASYLPSTPKNFKSIPAEYSGDEEASSMLLTPPETGHRKNAMPSRRSESGSLFDTPTKRKGKERSHPQWENAVQDEDQPFHQKASSLQPATPPRENQSIPRAADPFNGPVAGETPAEAIAGHLEALEKANAVEYILKLERKFSASEKSNLAKAKKIQELMAENTELKKQLSSIASVFSRSE
ncbi:hypothetical protein BJ138DRAFT_1125594 [Hygrophoropsis aurantiaca]|uniref:Uncharacterized protein n=1 Tax=Hygrophoropsis aurantiaca TaxID=72124 RepID=A0ACB8AF68_9AGAM|nr:hypothetical protein BJ138DRAFT_1125594 [Hygrophoropsis aurantiaca]